MLWLNGIPTEKLYAAYLVAHELGHAYGLVHAAALVCTTPEGLPEALLPWELCRHVPYGNLVDVMGAPFRLGNVSPALLLTAGYHQQARAAAFDPETSSSITLEPLSLEKGPHAATLSVSGITYVLEYRDTHGYDAPLGASATAGGPGVYLNAIVNDSKALPAVSVDGAPWSFEDAYLIDADPDTRDEHGQPSSWHIPLYEPLRLPHGGYLTVSRTTATARVHYTAPGDKAPAPPTPSTPTGLKATRSGESWLLAWRGDGTGTAFHLQWRGHGHSWKTLDHTPDKPNQPSVTTVVNVPHEHAKFRVRARNASGVSPFTPPVPGP